MSEFGKWLLEELAAVGWSGAELARRCEVTPPSIYRLTKSGESPSTELAIKIAKELGWDEKEVVLFAIFDGDKPKTEKRTPPRNDIPDLAGLDPRLVELFARGWKKFPPDVQRDLRNFVIYATPEDAIRVFGDAARTWLLHHDLPADDDTDDAHDSEPPEPEMGAVQEQLERRQRTKVSA